MQRDDYPSFIDWWIENQEEYEALADAEDGRLEVLSSFVKERGFLATQEARLFVSERILGQKKKRGNKRTSQNTANDVILLGEIIDLRKKHQCSEYQAIRHYMAKLPEPKNHREITSIETIRSAIKIAKLFFTEHMGRPPY